MSAPLLRGIDRAAFAVSFVDRLRASGVPVGFTGIDDFVRALAADPPRTRTQLYWCARLTLVRRHSELAAFDAVFAAAFEAAMLPLDPNARRPPRPSASPDDAEVAVPRGQGAEEADGGVPWATLPRGITAAEEADAGEDVLAVPRPLPSAVAGLLDVGFDELDPEQMRLLARWLEDAVRRRWPARRSRRLAIDTAGRRVAIRPTMARARRTGWEPVELVHVRPVARPRRVVMVCDVSRSMQAQASAYLHLMRALAVHADAEVFAFATGLTRLTPVLRHRSAEVAVAEATRKVADRFGGTRIASNLAALLASHHAAAMRGGIVVIASDGWDADPPEQMHRVMARIRRRAYRVVWINPRAGADEFEPRVGAMAAALPHCDAVLPADTFAALERVIECIGGGVSSTASRARPA
ncbi:MAG TPA: VWA domain-containing protein [Jatrophihabitans sp.]|nr:VWA domain-containing protein [Jatrophihabitans sp.]